MVANPQLLVGCVVALNRRVYVLRGSAVAREYRGSED